jgi:hypothetical protein
MGQSNAPVSSVRSKIEFINNLSQEHSPFISNPAIKTVQQELKESYIIPTGYNGVAVNLKIPKEVDLIIPKDSTVVFL